MKIAIPVAFLLIVFIFIDHFLVMVSFLTNAKLLPVVFSASLLMAIIVSLYLGRKEGLKNLDLFLK